MKNKTYNEIILTDPNKIDLNKNAVIEASAGTGKTYTIENLIVNLVKNNVELNKILVNTYTEKATVEMKERIRSSLEQYFKKNPDNKNVKNAVENFDECSIYTIHGLCHRILQEFAFENKQPFQLELVDDEFIYKKIFNKFKRKIWPYKFGEHLEELLQLGDFSDKWDNEIINLTRKLDLDKHTVYPQVDLDIDLGIKFFEPVLDKLVSLMKVNKNTLPEANQFYCNYEKINFKSITNSRKKNIIIPVIEILIMYLENTLSLSDIYFKIEKMKKTAYFKKDAFDCIETEEFKKPGDNLNEVCPEFYNVLKALNILYDKLLNYKYFLKISAVNQLKKYVDDYKKENSYITFDDMINIVEKSVTDKNNTNLVNSLREKYQYCLVDEFQDTDLKQWNIFKTVFLETSDSEHKLFIIGDPKQAIYGFRGADIRAYFKAKKYMLENKSAVLYRLKTNWRSSENLVESLNILFSKDWFIDKQFDFKVDVPEKKLRKSDIINDCSGKPALSIIKYENYNVDTFKNKFAEFVANEIKNLVNTNDIMFNLKNENDEYAPQKLEYSDICILIRKTKESVELEKVFNKHNIPYTFYKKKGLFSCDEVYHLKYIINAIAFPEDFNNIKKCFFTDFFGLKPDKIIDTEKFYKDKKINRLFDKWVELSMKSQWSVLFQSIIEDTKIFLRLQNEQNSERKIVNYKHIISVLENTAVENQFDIIELNELMNSYINRTIELSDDIDLHKLETEQPKVKIMTMHASKGLEFPVVFIFGGFTSSSSNIQYYEYYKNDKKVFDLVKSDRTAYELHEKQESERLLYVAFTRTVYKLYVPYYIPTTSGHEGSLINVFNKAADNLLKTYEKSYSKYIRIFNENNELIDSDKPVQQIKNKTNFDITEETENKIVLKNNIESKPELNFIFDCPSIYSYSGINYKLSKKNQSYHINMFDSLEKQDFLKTDDDDISGVKNYENNELPPGRFTGTLLHEIFEKLDYSVFKYTDNLKELLDNNELIDFINTQIFYNNMVDNKTIKFQNVEYKFLVFYIIKLLYNTLNTEVIDDFKLCNLKKNDKINELEFYYSNNKSFFTGIIDLIFNYNGKYFIADWKSNLLNNYDYDSLKQNMIDKNYVLQYKLYTVAVNKWLERYLNDYNFNRDFGGIFYFYLRGMKINNKSTGIFFYKPENINEIKSYEKEINSLI